MVRGGVGSYEKDDGHGGGGGGCSERDRDENERWYGTTSSKAVVQTGPHPRKSLTISSIHPS
jgi:hypothetical protein